MPELVTEHAHCVEKMFQIFVAIDQDLVVGDRLGHFRCEDEVGWSLEVPALNRRDRRRPVKRVVQFYDFKLSRVVAEEVAGLHPCGIEAAYPAFSRECTCSYAEVCHNRGILYRDHPWFGVKSICPVTRLTGI